MQTRRYQIELTGVSPLLMHADNIEAADAMERWQKDPTNKKGSKAGDDRTPAWRWLSCLYVSEGAVVVPSDNLMAMLRDAGKQCPTGKRMQSFKALAGRWWSAASRWRGLVSKPCAKSRTLPSTRPRRRRWDSSCS